MDTYNKKNKILNANQATSKQVGTIGRARLNSEATKVVALKPKNQIFLMCILLIKFKFHILFSINNFSMSLDRLIDIYTSI